ncbi:MAG: hypothetical protein NZM16_08500 [Thermoflexus sp.]|uniref:hypothetical protein n=1 Tax=Thermoflexus sp. TaxID=1969742 RepID=UPI0025D6F3EC|nr:hypothetical protein [Thermoflexus sp.]MCS6964072.1 hypothetical protein [Thermoflexus sp.]MDW8184547.1 hypothetical protein [Anaerolineae bacterium]
MAFTVQDFEDLLRLLDQHPQWREALRRRLLTEEFLESPKVLRDLSDRVQKIELLMGDLIETVKGLAESVAALAEAQRRHYEEFVAHRAEADRRFAELAEAQRRTEEQLQKLSESHQRLSESTVRMQEALQDLGEFREQTKEILDRFGQVIGPMIEERMIQALREWVAEQGGTLLGPVFSVTLDGVGEVDGVAQIRLQDGREVWVLVSAKTKVWPRSIREFVNEVLKSPTAVAMLQAEGIQDPVMPIVFGLTLDRRSMKAAQTSRVGLLISAQGMLVSPVLWSLKDREPIEGESDTSS